MYLPRALAFLFFTQAVLAQQPTQLLPDPKLTPGDVFDVTLQDILHAGLLEEGAGRSRAPQETGLSAIRDHLLGTGRLPARPPDPAVVRRFQLDLEPLAATDHDITLERPYERRARAKTAQPRLQRAGRPENRPARDRNRPDQSLPRNTCR